MNSASALVLATIRVAILGAFPRHIGSDHRADEPAPTIGSASVAIGAYHLALLDLFEDALPGAIAQSLGDPELFVSQVVELQDEGVALSAIEAWMLFEEGN